MKDISKKYNILNDILIVNTRVLYYQCYGRLIHGNSLESIEAYRWRYVEKVYHQCVKEIDWETKDGQRATATNGKIGPVDLSKNENDWEGLKEW